MHRVPFTAGSPTHDSSTLSTVAVLISSANSMAVPAAAAEPRRSLPLPGTGTCGQRLPRDWREKGEILQQQSPAWKPPLPSLSRWAL